MMRVWSVLALLISAAVVNAAPFSYKILLSSGVRINPVTGGPYNAKGLAYGQIVDSKGNGVHNLATVLNTQTTPALTSVQNKNYQIAQDPDFTSIIQLANKEVYHVANFERVNPPSHYVTKLQQNAVTGELTVLGFKPADWSAWGGVLALCAGSRSPWNTHLAGEESDPDARVWAATTSMSGFPGDFRGSSGSAAYARYYQYYPSNAINNTFLEGVGPIRTDMDVTKFKELFNPYKYGYAVEVAVAPGFKVTTQKYYAWGRFSWEMPLVMPDQRTIYGSDDYTTSTLYMFKGKPLEGGKFDLYNGEMFVSKLTAREPCAHPQGCFNVAWIKLGDTSQTEVANFINNNGTFADIFDVTDVPIASACPEGSRPNYISGSTKECLTLKAGMQNIAAAVETRRMASYMNATVEIMRIEGITLDTVSRKLYMASTQTADAMSSATANRDIAMGYSDMNVTQNDCGTVYAGTLNAKWTLTTFDAVVAGIPRTDTRLTTTSYGPSVSCDMDSIASPDNLAFIPGTKTLMIMEDTSRHQNDMVWAFNTVTGELVRVATQAYGGEWTGASYSACIGGWNYLTLVIQHPYGESDYNQVAELGASTGGRAYVGYFPFKCSDMVAAARKRAALEFPNRFSATGKGVNFASGIDQHAVFIVAPTVTFV